MPKLYIKTYGCQMNERDSEQVARMFVQKGYTMTDREDEADVILFNSCSIREQAEQKALGKMGLLAKQQRHRPHVVYGMMGCMAQSKKEELFKELPRLDLVVGTQKYHRVFEHVDGILRARQERRMDELQTAFSGTHVCDVAEEADSQNRIRDHLNPGVRSTAYVSIMQGCEMKCAYCIVPYTRGAERSRPIRDVVDEVKMLADAGVKELLVIAQDITRYGTDLNGEHQLASLLRELCRLDFHWVRLHYLYPDEITEELIDTIAEEPKIVKYLDIPIQHCNDKVLRAMNRRGDKAELLALFRKLRARIPGLVLRTSLITGLPFEDEAAFEELCEFLREVRIERAGVFPYSPEEGTPAARMLNRVDTAEAERRAELVVDVQSRIMDDFNDSRMGTVVEVLCDGFDQQAMQFVGRSYAESPDIDGRIYFTADHEVEAGEFVPVRITGTMDGELTGQLAE